MSIAYNQRQTMFNSEQLRAAQWLEQNGHPVNRATVNRVLNNWQRSRQRREQQERQYQQAATMVQPAQPQQVPQPQQVQQVQHKYTHNTT